MEPARHTLPSHAQGAETPTEQCPLCRGADGSPSTSSCLILLDFTTHFSAVVSAPHQTSGGKLGTIRQEFQCLFRTVILKTKSEQLNIFSQLLGGVQTKPIYNISSRLSPLSLSKQATHHSGTQTLLSSLLRGLASLSEPVALSAVSLRGTMIAP